MSIDRIIRNIVLFAGISLASGCNFITAYDKEFPAVTDLRTQITQKQINPKYLVRPGTPEYENRREKCIGFGPMDPILLLTDEANKYIFSRPIIKKEGIWKSKFEYQLPPDFFLETK